MWMFAVCGWVVRALWLTPFGGWTIVLCFFEAAWEFGRNSGRLFLMLLLLFFVVDVVAVVDGDIVMVVVVVFITIRMQLTYTYTFIGCLVPIANGEWCTNQQAQAQSQSQSLVWNDLWEMMMRAAKQCDWEINKIIKCSVLLDIHIHVGVGRSWRTYVVWYVLLYYSVVMTYST